jgi:hypothetical protein
MFTTDSIMKAALVEVLLQNAQAAIGRSTFNLSMVTVQLDMVLNIAPFVRPRAPSLIIRAPDTQLI